MSQDANARYMALLGAIGAAIENDKNDLAFARYEIENLQNKLKAAEEELARLKGENNAE